MSVSSSQELIEGPGGELDRGRVPSRAAAPLQSPMPWKDEPRETSGLTSRLILAYLEREGGQGAVEQVLARCGLEDAKSDLLNESHWFSFATKIRLFEAAAEVLDAPHVARHVGENAIDL